MEKVLIVHPEDKTTAFLSKIKNSLKNQNKVNVHHFNVKPNDHSHQHCLDRIENQQSGNLVIFLGHGKSNSLCGGKGKHYDLIGQNDILLQEHPANYYYKEEFIHIDNVGVFKNKNVFCLSCRSREKISTYIVDAGATSVVGFGNIPTSKEEFEEMGYKNVSHDLVRLMKTEVNYIVKTSLMLAITNNFTIDTTVNYVKFVTSQRMVETLTNKAIKDRLILADNLYNFKNDITILGDKKTTVYPK